MPDTKPLKMREVVVDMFRVQKRPGISFFWWFVLRQFHDLYGSVWLPVLWHLLFRKHFAYHAAQMLARPSRSSGLINLVIAMTFALAAGILSDKFGRRNIIIVSVLIAGIVGLFFPFARSICDLPGILVRSTGLPAGSSSAWIPL